MFRIGLFSTIVFISCSQNEPVIYENNPNDFAPSMSKDGTKLLYYTYRNGPAQIYYYDLIKREEIQVTHHDTFWDFNPTWAAGDKIVFQSNRNGKMGIYEVNMEGDEPILLVQDTLWNATPTMSNKGDKIAYSSRNPASDNFEIKIKDLLSGEVTTISSGMGHNLCPEWSPDDSSIYFHSSRYGNNDIFVVNVDGSGLRRLTNGSANENTPRISKDGRRLLFAANYSSPENNYKQRTSEIYVMNIDGSEKKKLSENSFDEFFPNWIDSERILFSSDFRKSGKHYFKIYEMNMNEWNPKLLIN